ncbi:MAG: methionyl-tRNA formyltransferase [Nitrososphaerota archaeon]
MNIAYISGVKYGHEFLNAIINAEWKISAVFSYDDSKRHLYSDFASFDDITEKHGIKHIKVKNINDLDNVKFLEQIKPDVILVMGWSQLLKLDILKIPKIGVIGSHPTELPKFRGRAPIPWSIIKGLKESALTFFYMCEGIDDGDILDQQKFEINEEDDAESIYEKIINIGKRMLLINLELLEKGEAKKIKQDPAKFIEYWPKRTPEDGKIEWAKNGKDIHRLIRATTRPYPGAFCFFKNNLIKIWKARYLDEKSDGCGKIMKINKDSMEVGTGEGVLSLQKISVDNSEILNPAQVFSKEDIGLNLK